MKKLILFTLILFLVTCSAFTINHNVLAAQNKVIHQSYTVSAVHDTYIVAQSNSYKGEYINFYYTDQKEHEHFNVNDKIVAYFQVYKHSFQIVDFKKVTPKLIKQIFTITSYSNGQYQAVNNTKGTDKAKLFFTQSDSKSSHSVSVGDIITAYYQPLKGEDQFLYVK